MKNKKSLTISVGERARATEYSYSARATSQTEQSDPQSSRVPHNS
jgi:hypothetical protein